jgi:hypothetical protein
LLAASIGLATAHEKVVPGMVEAVDQALLEADPSLREAATDLLGFVFQREQRIPMEELPYQIGLWVLRSVKDTSQSLLISEAMAAAQIGHSCLRMAATWDIEMEPSLLILSLKTAAVRQHSVLLGRYRILSAFPSEQWDLLFTIATLFALTIQRGGDELLSDSLARELRAFHPTALDLFGSCADFVASSLRRSGEDPKPLRALAIALGRWILSNGFNREPLENEHELVTVIGTQVLTIANEV